MVSIMQVNNYRTCCTCLSIDDIAVLVHVLLKTLLVGGHGTEAHTHAAESSVVEEVLHRNLACEVREHHHAIVGTVVGTGIASG